MARLGVGLTRAGYPSQLARITIAMLWYRITIAQGPVVQKAISLMQD